MDAKRFKTSIKAKILLGFGSAIVILLTTGIISYQSFNDLMRSLDFLSRPDVKLVKLNDILSDLSLSESHIRSYFISSEKRYLDQYSFYSGKLENNIDSLARLIKESQTDSGKVKKILKLWEEKKRHTQDLIALHEKKRESKLPDDILERLNKAHPDIPTIIITKTTTIKSINKVPEKSARIEEEILEEKRSLFSRIFKGKNKEVLKKDTVLPMPDLVYKTETIIDTIYTVGQANEVKEEAFHRILARIRKQNSQSRKMLKDNETEIIHKDIGLIEYIRNIVMDLKIKEEKITQRNIQNAKQIVEGSLIRIFLFGISGISGILIFWFMIMSDIAKNNYHKNQLLAAKTHAEELVKTKENFLATMSHEIRTPLNSIVGFTEQLSQTNLQNRQRYYLQAVSNSTAHLLSLVNDILDLSRIEAGKIDLETTFFNVREIIEEVYKAFYLKAEEKKLLLTYSFTGGDQLLLGDPFRLKQILFNLVSNAIKFTEHGEVSIICDKQLINEEEASVFISVRDTGIGIPSGKMNDIFDSFSQADSSISRKYGGTGLGLSITRKLIELQNGEIHVSSKEGEGSVFQVYLTYKMDNANSSMVLNQETLDMNLLQGMKILVVEDDEFNLLLFHTILVKWNMKVRVVSSGEEALEMLDLENFDLVITDIHMPGISGVELCKRIKSHGNKKVSDLPVLAVTANVIKESTEVFKNSGFSGILLKPFKEEQLGKAILIAIDSLKPDNYLPVIPCNTIEPEQQDVFSDFIKFAGGDMKVTKELAEAFITNASQQLERLTICHSEKEWEMLKETAHKLIPGFGHLHNLEITNLLEQMEIYLDQEKNPDELKLQKMIQLIVEKGFAQIKVMKSKILQ